ncbi:Eukaryotic translation initiation factor 5 [Thelohanellus kitauei]|uniref:Eukaryotic translation initiation factor 5 n=1 Tax=Thelohanellus kitauei TaxID=669202 RepID=A0A0C2MMC5_THEKT|nr:Eukaryotic translation initiation factor 5 [Thelohanellus kitauei]
MANININKDVQDPFYRYKMPKLSGKVEGRGNGIKTVLNNIIDVSKSLNVPPDYPTKFLGIELGAQVIIDTKKDKYIINGSHNNEKLQELLYSFINRYIICSMCKNPETYLSVAPKNNNIVQSCNACGNSSIIPHPHKFDSYIVKHRPKPVDKKSEGTAEKNVKVQEGSLKPESTNGKVNVHKVTTDPTCATETDHGWFTDVSEEAVRQRMFELTGRTAEMTMNEDLEKSLKKRMEILLAFIKNEMAIPHNDWVDKVVHESRRLDLADEAIVAIADVLFQSDDLLKIITVNRVLIKKLVQSRQAERNLLGSIEISVSKNHECLIPRVSKIFMCLYQLDLVEEDIFLEWSQKKSKRYLGDAALTDRVHKSAAEFMNWLKTAEEEASSEDEDIEFEKPTEETVDEYNCPNRLAPEIKKSDDDLNIDDI